MSKCISHLFNSIIHLGKIPTIWKKDIIVPIHKGNNKPKKSPDSYRPIALLPCLMKLFEKILIQRIRLHILPSTQFPNPQQQGFQPSLGSITASFNLQETIFHNIEHGSPVYVAFLDTQKAFDTVWRHGLMFKLRHLGVTGSLWTLIDDCHSNTFCSVAVNQTNSDWFPVSQGVRQGGVLSTFLYLVFINDLLHELQNKCLNTGIYNIKTSNPTLADDISCISLSPRGLQVLLDTAYSYSTRWRFIFNANKSTVLRFSSSDINTGDPSWQLGEDNIKVSKTYTHLGILLDAKMNPKERTTNACRKGQLSYFSLKINEHVNPATLSKLYKRVILPSVLYGCELWCDLRQKDIRSLNTFQHFICKHAMNLPKQTRSDMCESLFGLLPITSEIDKRKLQFLGRLCRLESDSLTKQIFLNRLFSYTDFPKRKHYGFIPDVINLLKKYNLETHLHSYLQSGMFPLKKEWKRIVSSTIYNHFSTTRSTNIQTDPDFSLFRSITHNRHPDTLWKIPTNYQEGQLCKFIVKLWTLSDIHPEICTICHRFFSNIFEHVSTACTATLEFREAWWQTIIENFDITLSAELCGLNSRDLYLFLLGARTLPGLTFIDQSSSLHLLNFRLLRDAAARYYRMTTPSNVETLTNHKH